LSKVELFEQIRLARRDERLGQRGLADRFGVHRRVVAQALASPVPPERKIPVRVAPVTGVWRSWIRDVLVADLLAPVKQRHTAERIRVRLAEEHGVTISASSVRKVVAELRIEVGVPAVLPVFVPQTRLPGSEGEVDWGQFVAVIGGVQVTLHLFSMWLGFSTRSFHYAYANEAQESFMDAHMRAFDCFGGVPLTVRYDNLKTAVVRILRGRSRDENAKFVTLRSHYGFDSFFCEPGRKGAHEKGGVEHDIGRYRRWFLTPVPRFDTIGDLNVYLAACNAKDDLRFVTGRGPGAGATVFGLSVLEQGAMWPLPLERFDATTRLSVRVDTKARVCVRQCHYSVPARHVGTRLNVRLGAETITVHSNDGTQVAAHTRAVLRNVEVLDVDHYLEVLWRRPGAFPGSTALLQARATGRFTTAHQQFWDAAKRKVGDRDAVRLICEVLLLHRSHDHAHVVTGIRAAISIDSIDPAIVAIETRRAIEHQTPQPPSPVERLPNLADYDQLLKQKAASPHG
jgi:transposase